MNRKLLREAEKFQKREIAKLAKLSYEDLLALPKTRRLVAPPGLHGQRFTIEKTPHKRGWVEVAVIHHLPRDRELEREIVEWLEDVSGETASLGPSSMSQFFLLGPKGQIEWPDTTPHRQRGKA